MNKNPFNEEIKKQRLQINELQLEHHDLDEIIDRLAQDPAVDQLKIKRLKKRKLILKDMITKLQSKIIPDLGA